MEFDEYLRTRREIVEEELNNCFPETLFPETLVKSIRYSLLNSGKRIRPILMLAVADMFGTPYQTILPFACAVEMIHTYTLIHDDLPAMDNDDYRRGKLTNHKVFGDAIAILAGDALLTEAFRIMSEAALKNKFSSKKTLEVIYEISSGCGINGVVGGQVMDILSENKTIDLPTLQYIHTHKTGALIVAVVRAGAILSFATKRDLQRLTEYGKCLGLAFQIQDDILDVEGSFEKLGKKPGVDSAKKKNTYPSLVGMKESKEMLAQLMDKAYKVLLPYDEKAKYLRNFIFYLQNRQS